MSHNITPKKFYTITNLHIILSLKIIKIVNKVLFINVMISDNVNDVRGFERIIY